MSSKCQDSKFKQLLLNYDIIGLLETWLPDVNDCDNMLPGYKAFSTAARRIGKRGRCSGGVKVFVRENILKYIDYLDSPFPFGVTLKIDRALFGKDVIFMIVYLPPENSKAYTVNEPNGMWVLEEEIALLRNKFPNFEFVVSGDMNARTKDEPDYILDDNVRHLPLEQFYTPSFFQTPRLSKDLHGDINMHGQHLLLQICKEQDSHILNGRTEGDVCGELTCFTHSGSSIVDYTLASSSLFQLFTRFEILPVDDYTHLPQAFTMNSFPVDNTSNEDRDKLASHPRLRFRWTEESLEKLMSENANVMFNRFHDMIDNNNVNEATTVLTNVLQDVCFKSKCKVDINVKSSKGHAWWDEELEGLRKRKYKRLRLLRLEHSEIALQQYRQVRNSFKKLVRQKKMIYRLKIKEKLEKCKSSAEFWSCIHSIKNPSSCINSINSNTWKEYFSILFNSANELDAVHLENVESFMSSHNINCAECNGDDAGTHLNRNVTISEVDEVISKLKIGKASGMDGISNECLKQSKNILSPLLSQLFNKILETGEFPNAWCNALIIPIHKSGSVNDPGNYRGISLLSCISKVFTKVLNNRLVSWATENGKMFEEQGGFTKGRGTIEQIFILQSLISKYLSKKGGRCYTVFVDFSKAFDTIPHLHMFLE